MRTFIFLAVSLFSIAFLGSCVESSQKYKALQAKADSLQAVSNGQSDEMDKLLADLNDISAGMQSIREAEHILAIESQSDTKNSKSKSQITALKNDVQALSDAIAGYKEKIAKLEGTNKRQSAEFKKLIAGLNEELAIRDQKINEINQILAAKEKEHSTNSRTKPKREQFAGGIDRTKGNDFRSGQIAQHDPLSVRFQKGAKRS